MNTNERPTPETDAVSLAAEYFSQRAQVAPAEHAEHLERQRDEAREKAQKLWDVLDEIASSAACLPGYSIAEAAALARTAIEHFNDSSRV